MREINLDQCRTLATIADTGSFAAAAKRLHLSPPTVSLHIAELESRLGVTLLWRTRRGVAMTPIGEDFLTRARQLLRQADDTLEAVARKKQGLEGRVRVGASTGVLTHHLPRALKIMGNKFPNIEIQVAVLTSQEALHRIELGALDIGLIALPQQARPGLTIRPWRRDAIQAYLPSAWQAPAQITPKWLAQQALILNDESTHLHHLSKQWFLRAGVDPQARIELNFNDAIKSLVAAGYGAALLPNEGLNQGQPPSQQSGQQSSQGHAAAREDGHDSAIALRPLKPALWRPLGIVYRSGALETATNHVLEALRLEHKH
jgi:DNA-binding transcriptional LysR family regulator